MTQTCWLLIEAQSGYRLAKAGGDSSIGDLVAPPHADPAKIATAVQDFLKQRGYGGEPILLAVSSRNALAATFPLASKAMARKHDAMAYALEEFLPLAAEDMVCDFVVLDSEALGVGAELNELGPLLSALEEHGVVIASIVPTAVLAIQHYLKNEKPRDRHVVLWQHEDAIELFELINGKPRVWRRFPPSREVLNREIRLLGVVRGPSGIDGLTVCALSEEMRKAVQMVAGSVEVTVQEQVFLAAASQCAGAILSGREAPWIELRREPLGRYDPYRPIRASLRLAAVAAACLLLSFSVAAWIRAEKYESVVQHFQREQESLFRRIFPGMRVPVGVRARLESEHRKLAGISGKLEGVPRLESAAGPMCDVLGPLPEDLRYRLLEIRLEEGRVYLDGEVRRHGDADLLATALRENGFRVDAPRTEQLAETGVAVTMTASRQPGEHGLEEKGTKP